MISSREVREELRNIRYYYMRKDDLDGEFASIGENSVLNTIKRYNEAVCKAPPRLYDLYVLLYLQNNTQESLSSKLGYTPEHISRLNSSLVRFLQKYLSEKEAN